MKKSKKFAKVINFFKVSSPKSRILIFVIAFAFVGSILLRASFAASTDTYYCNSYEIHHQDYQDDNAHDCAFPYLPNGYPEWGSVGLRFSQQPGLVAWYGPYADKQVSNPSGIGMRVCFTAVVYAGAEYPVYYQFDAVSNQGTFWAVNQRGWDWAMYMKNKVHGSYLGWWQDLTPGNPFAAGRICRDLPMNAGRYTGIQFRVNMTACYTYYYTLDKCRLYIKKVSVDYH